MYDDRSPNGGKSIKNPKAIEPTGHRIPSICEVLRGKKQVDLPASSLKESGLKRYELIGVIRKYPISTCRVGRRAPPGGDTICMPTTYFLR